MKEFQKKMTVFDIGGRGGIHRSWNNFPIGLDYFSFEPELDEFNSLSKEIGRKKDNTTFNVLDIAVAGKTEERTFYQTNPPHCSSLYLINPESTVRYGKTKVTKQTKIRCMSIDDIVKKINVKPEYLSIDAQGASLEIIKGASSVLNNCIKAIRCEYEWVEFYKSQPLIYELFPFLISNQFKLLRLETCGSGAFCITSDMNKYSVSPIDAKPFSGDAIFINEGLINRSFDNGMSFIDVVDLVYTAMFCIYNGCGYYGLELLERLKKSQYFDNYFNSISKDERNCILSNIACYLNIERKNINKNFNKNEIFKDFFDESIELYLQIIPAPLKDRINSIYDEQSLITSFLDPGFFPEQL